MLDSHCGALAEPEDWVGVGYARSNTTRTAAPRLYASNWTYVISAP